jgi:hypothetical protein
MQIHLGILLGPTFGDCVRFFVIVTKYLTEHLKRRKDLFEFTVSEISAHGGKGVAEQKEEKESLC